MFLLFLLSGGFCHKWMLNFVKGLLCIYWNNHMVFIFQFVNVVYYIDWFADIARQQKRHRCIEQSFGLCGRGQGWDDLGEWHWNMYIIICETNLQSRFDAWYRMLGAGPLWWPRGMGWGGRWDRGSGWGTHVHLWRIQCMAKPLSYWKVISLQLK